MEAVNINGNDQIIKGLREQLEARDHELTLKNEAIAKEADKLKKSNLRAKTAKEDLRLANEKIAELTEKLDEASVVELDTSGAQSKIDKAMSTLNTINQLNEMNGGRGDFTKDQIQLVVRELIGVQTESTLLLG